MITHLEQELRQIQHKIYKMMDLSIEAINNAINALTAMDLKKAKQIIDADSFIDETEMLIDEECIRLLVTKQPAAVDLRLVLSILKINTDLERIGDLATNIAKQTIRLINEKQSFALKNIPEMAKISIEMLKDALKAFTEKNADLARKVIEQDLEVDKLNEDVHKDMFQYISDNKKTVFQGFSLLMISKSIERIGDHITNIAERTIYYIEGKDIRHHHVE